MRADPRAKQITKEEAIDLLQNKGFNKSLYSGRQEGCRCGCLGTYYDANQSGMKVETMLRMHKRIIAAVQNAEIIQLYVFDNPNERCLDLVMPNGRVYSAYNYL